jgi:hypothetical protein
MTTDPGKFEIPLPLRQLAEQNVEQSRIAYSQVLEMTRKATEAMTSASQEASEAAGTLQMRIAQHTQQNADAAFAYASDLARARTLQEYMEIQQRWMQRQMQTYAEQAQEIGQLMAAAAQKATPKP